MGRRLSAEDWITAAFAAFEERGLDAVAVEPIAARLGATKGSFYWHFANRGELIDAVLSRWRAETDLIIANLEPVTDPRTRLRLLFEDVVRCIPSGGGEIDLLGRTGPPSMLRIRAEVSDRRISFMANALRERGMSPVAARDRATQLYALWIGMLELTTALPGALPQGRGGARLRRSTIALMETLVG